MENFEEMCSILTEFRTKLGYSVNEMTEILGCSRMMLWKMEHGQVKNLKRSLFIKDYLSFLIEKYDDLYADYWYITDLRYINLKKKLK